jgi:hypothetical protein
MGSAAALDPPTGPVFRIDGFDDLRFADGGPTP